tara:strand:- start:63 stop:407 length:345 start_codon:yes stop_codon:yes gene_type:complete
MRLKDYLLLASFLINIGLSFWLYNTSTLREDFGSEVNKSKGRVEMLEEKVSNLSLEIGAVNKLKDSISIELLKKPKERVIIKKVYENEVTRVINLPIDSSLLYLSKRLSETNIN